jgi:hypothetical protein
MALWLITFRFEMIYVLKYELGIVQHGFAY